MLSDRVGYSCVTPILADPAPRTRLWFQIKGVIVGVIRYRPDCIGISFSVDGLRFFADPPMTITDTSGATVCRTTY